MFNQKNNESIEVTRLVIGICGEKMTSFVCYSVVIREQRKRKT
jgi:hypothetical protein